MGRAQRAFYKVTVLRCLLLAAGCCGLPAVALERSLLQARVEAVRQALPAGPALQGPLAQWNNWNNWANWANWANAGQG